MNKNTYLKASGKWLGIAVTVLTLAACATTFDQGINAYNRGNYDEAYNLWLPYARAGDAGAQHNLGLIWENGYGFRQPNARLAKFWFSKAANQGSVMSMIALGKIYESEEDLENAFAYYYQAARWGDRDGIAGLRRLKAPIPDADLQRRAQLEQAVIDAQKAEALAGLAGAIGGAIGCSMAGGGCGGSVPPTTPTQYRSQQVVPTKVLNGPSSCRSNYDCPNSTSYRCVKAPLQFEGVCLKLVNEYGTQQFQVPSSSNIGMSNRPQCNFTTDCPIGFRCDTKLKACVK